MPTLTLWIVLCTLPWLAEPFSLLRSKEGLQELCDFGCSCPTEEMTFTFLDCARREIDTLPTDIDFLEDFKDVSFQGNGIRSLAEDTFYRAPNVEKLDLSLNNIETVADTAFFPFRSLTVLFLSHNFLTTVSPGLLDGVSDLRVLELSHNKLKALPSEVFISTPNLRELRLHYNPLRNLEQNTFQFLTHLERLDLENTELTILHDDIFRFTPRLQWLSLAGNSFTQVPTKALKKAPSLSSLDLSGNSFSTFPSGSFSSLANLTFLYVSKLDSLITIDKNAFTGLKSLKSLSCSYNGKLSSIDAAAFGYNSTPQEQLFLRQNALKTLPFNLVKWSQLTYVDLRDNPWQCDCNLRWMTELKWEVKRTIRCNNPWNLRGQLLTSVSVPDMVCTNWIFSTSVLVAGALAGFLLIIGIIVASVCSRSPLGLFLRSRVQYKYSRVVPKKESVDLEWDHSAEI